MTQNSRSRRFNVVPAAQASTPRDRKATKKFKAKMNYADKLKVPFVAFLGEDEVKNGVVSLKDMASGVQESVALTAAPGWLAEKVAGLGVGTPIRDRE